MEAVREVEEERDDDDRDEREILHLVLRPAQHYAFLTAMFAITFAAVSQESIARSSPS